MGPGVLLLLVAVAVAVRTTDATVTVPFNKERIVASFETIVICTVENENFVGWFNLTDNSKVDDKYITIDAAKNGYNFRLPAGIPVYAAGKYECRGSINKATVELEATCNLNDAKEEQVLLLGQTGKIVVQCHSYPRSTFSWTKDGAVLDPNAGRLKMDEYGSITISDVQKGDGGKYSVVADWNGRKTPEKTFTIIVGSMPKFTHAVPLPSQIVGILNYNFTFCCNASGDRTPTISWTKKTPSAEIGIDLANPSKYVMNDGCLVIKNLQTSDVASYKCLAKNNIGEISAEVEVTRISEQAVITSDIKDATKVVGDAFEVACEATGASPLSVEWKRNGSPYLGQEKSNGKSVIKIQSLKLSDAAQFTCTASNGLQFNGKDVVSTKSFKLTVEAPPTVVLEGSKTPLHSFVGNTIPVTIKCQFTGLPMPTVVMTKDGKEVAKGNGTAQLDVVTSVTSDFGTFICEANNKRGRKLNNIMLKMAVPPGKPLDVKANKTCDTITLSWKHPASDGGMYIEDYIISVGSRKEATIDDKKQMFKLESKFQRNTKYNVSIQARNKAGPGERETLYITTDKYCIPSPPKITSKQTESNGPEYMVTWEAPDFDGHDPDLKYRVEWTRTSEPVSDTMKSPLLDVMEYMITKLKNGDHKLEVFAVNKGGDSMPDRRVFTVSDSETASHNVATMATANVSVSPRKPTTNPTQVPPKVGKRTGGMSKGAIAGIVIAVLLIVLITIDLFCCFFNSCGLIFCCQKAICGGGKTTEKYEADGEKKGSEMEKLKPDAENV
ncbi:neural cell adhesion molecule 2 isoform X2 [Nematostella vectensis]|uniref:neural cell adhesion molecule 2 isoform X2 n=1 Tax=Nematostella vectensis TaxID=45351 RepID=UPI00139035C2|nr:neural cell adhesion molecule 2 isoform X2 [Nematostella vectensis]